MSTPSTQPVVVPDRSAQQAPATPAPRPESKPFTIKLQGGIPS